MAAGVGTTAPAPYAGLKRWSLRRRLIILVLAVAATSLTAVDIVIPISVRASLLGTLDSGLASLVSIMPTTNTPADLARLADQGGHGGSTGIRLIREITWPRSVSIGVVNEKGGSGKTPFTLCLAGTLASIRGGGVAAEARQGQGTFVIVELLTVAPADLAKLRRWLGRWLQEASALGLDIDDVTELFNGEVAATLRREATA